MTQTIHQQHMNHIIYIYPIRDMNAYHLVTTFCPVEVIMNALGS